VSWRGGNRRWWLQACMRVGTKWRVYYASYVAVRGVFINKHTSEQRCVFVSWFFSFPVSLSYLHIPQFRSEVLRGLEGQEPKKVHAYISLEHDLRHSFTPRQSPAEMQHRPGTLVSNLAPSFDLMIIRKVHSAFPSLRRCAFLCRRYGVRVHGRNAGLPADALPINLFFATRMRLFSCTCAFCIFPPARTRTGRSARL
jgi:hypothetical protein